MKKLILFTRYPEAGRAKTRLIPALGPQGAADLQRRMTEETLKVVDKTSLCLGYDLEIRYEGNETDMAGWLGRGHNYRIQGPGDLGKKMARAFGDAFENEFGRVIIIGADCPSLTAEIIASGFSVLEDHDLVLGPATDGGYYLIGLSCRCPELFADKSWGSNSLLAETLATARGKNLTFHLLEELADVDRPEDLENLGDHPYFE